MWLTHVSDIRHNDRIWLSWRIDDAEIFDGAHVGVQIVGRRLQEEKVLALAEYLGDAVKSERPGHSKI